MISSDFRTEARRKLDGKWGKAACMILAYVFVFFVFGLIQSLFPESMQGILSLIVNIIELPLGFGLIVSLVKLFYDEEVNAFSFWSIGFKNFVKPWGITWNIFLKMIIPYILIIVAYVLIIFGIFGSFATYLTATDNVSSLYYYNRIHPFNCICNLGCYKILLLSISICNCRKRFRFISKRCCFEK